MLDRDKHSSLFALLVSYKEKTCESALVLPTNYARLEQLARDKHCSLFGLFVSYEEKTCQLSPGLNRKLHLAEKDCLGHYNLLGPYVSYDEKNWNAW